MLHGAGDEADTFELEMSAQEIADGVKFYSLNDCIYYRFPALVEKKTGWNDNPGNPQPVAPRPAQLRRRVYFGASLLTPLNCVTWQSLPDASHNHQASRVGVPLQYSYKSSRRCGPYASQQQLFSFRG
jgi:hypothetical protein